jgi:hypothetical protein
MFAGDTTQSPTPERRWRILFHTNRRSGANILMRWPINRVERGKSWATHVRVRFCRRSPLVNDSPASAFGKFFDLDRNFPRGWNRNSDTSSLKLILVNSSPAAIFVGADTRPGFPGLATTNVPAETREKSGRIRRRPSGYIGRYTRHR